MHDFCFKKCTYWQIRWTIKSTTYINSGKKINNKDPKLKIGDIVRISKYKNIFAKVYTLSEEF